MAWFISSIGSLSGAVLLQVPHHGGDKGLWLAVMVLFVHIAVVGGLLMAFLIRSARRKDRSSTSTDPAPNGLRGQNGNYQ